jgi:hypothetical protein
MGWNIALLDKYLYNLYGITYILTIVDIDDKQVGFEHWVNVSFLRNDTNITHVRPYEVITDGLDSGALRPWT